MLTGLRAGGYRQGPIEVLNFFRENYKDLQPIAWIDAVELFEYHRISIRSVRPRTATEDSATLMRLAKASDNVDLHTTDLDTLRVALYDPKYSNRTQREYRDRLHSFFDWAFKENYYPTNPIKNWERPKVKKTEVIILNHKQVQKLLDNAGDMLGYFALCLFSGVRPDEAKRLEWDDVDLANYCVWVKWGRAKTRAGRVRISENLRAILGYCKNKSPRPGHFNRRKFNYARGVAGILDKKIWVNDVCRHTYASNEHERMLAEGIREVDAKAQLMEDMRTGWEMLKDNYLTQIMRDDPKEYPYLVPECLKPMTSSVKS